MPDFPYLFAWLASLAYGFEVIASKFTSKHSIKNPWFLNFFCSLFTLIFTVPFAFGNSVEIPTSWGNLLVASLLYALSSITFVLMLYRLDVSVFAPLYNFRTAFAVIFGVILLNETLTSYQYLLILIILAAGMFVSVDEKLTIRSFFHTSMLLAVVHMVILALVGVYVKKVSAEIGYWEVFLWMPLLAQFMLCITIPMFRKEIASAAVKHYGVTALIGAISVFAALAANKAYTENVSISSAIISIPFSMIMAFLFSVFAPQLLEKHSKKVYAIRFVAAAVMIGAALQLSL